jgi:hypothetical protein
LADRLAGCAEYPSATPMLLNPPDDFVLKPGDKLCAMATDQRTFRVREAPASYTAGAITDPQEVQVTRERVPNQQLLICNWRDDMEDILQEVDKRAGPGAVLTVLSNLSLEERQVRRAAHGTFLKGCLCYGPCS